jgi:Arc/MetJ-type ribon-helix-helix transcriptional regulator
MRIGAGCRHLLLLADLLSTLGSPMPRQLDLADLPEPIARFAQAQVAAGKYASIEEVLAAGVEALRRQSEADEEWLDYARALWSDRVAAAERGEFSEGNSAEMMARIRARVERNAP